MENEGEKKAEESKVDKAKVEDAVTAAFVSFHDLLKEGPYMTEDGRMDAYMTFQFEMTNLLLTLGIDLNAFVDKSMKLLLARPEPTPEAA